MESAPAMKRSGGRAWSVMATSARASLAGSPPYLPFWDFQNSICFSVRSAATWQAAGMLDLL
jgi:hypothetical protein